MAIDKTDVLVFLILAGVILWMLLAGTVAFFHHINDLMVPFRILLLLLLPTITFVIIAGYIYASIKGALR